MKTKILFIASEFAPGMIPFASTIITLLSKDERFDVYALVVNSGKKTYSRTLEEMDKNKIIQIEYPKSKLIKMLYKFYPLSIIDNIKKLDNDLKPDIIHLLTGDFTLAPYLTFRRPKDNWYYTVHDLYPHEASSKNIMDYMLRKYKIWGYKKLRDRISNLTTSSRSQYIELKRIYTKKKVEFTHFPSLITSQIRKGGKIVNELISEKNYILFFGNVNKYKGVDLLIKAYNQSDTLQSFKLVIAGKGLGLIDEVSKNNTNIIRINRFIDDAEVKYLFENSLFVVYPYRSVTMSGVLSIAYYFKKRVLASSIPFFLDNRTQTTFFFECNNINDLQFKMEFLACDKNMIFNADMSYNEIYSEEIINDYIKLYMLKNETRKSCL